MFQAKKVKINRWIETLSWYGVGAILLAYAMLTLDIWQSHNLAYVVLNITGSLGLLLDTYLSRDYQPAVLNLIWALLGLVALARLLL